MNILIISALFPPEPGISAKIAYEIAEELSKAHQVTVICPKPSRPLGFKFSKLDDNQNFDLHVLDSFTCPESNLFGRFRESFSFGLKSREFINRHKNDFDVIYMNAWPLFGQYIISKSAKSHDIKVVTHVQDMYPESLSSKFSFFASVINWLLMPYDRYVLSNANKAIAISEKMKQHLVKTRKLAEEKIVAIRNWQDESSFVSQKENRTSKCFTFMYLGNLSPAAGVDLIIHSFQYAHLPNARLVIAGSGSELENCKKIALGNDNIQFVEAPQHLVPDIQAQSDLLILPLKKGVGLTASPSKLPAYMFSKKPIIACVDAESDTADLIHRAKCGWVLQPEDKESLAKLMRTVVELPKAELVQRGENGFGFSMANFSKRSNLEKLTNEIVNVVLY